MAVPEAFSALCNTSFLFTYLFLLLLHFFVAASVLTSCFLSCAPLQGGRREPAGQDPGGPRASPAGGQGEAAQDPRGAAGGDPDGEEQGGGGPEEEGRAQTPAARAHAQGGGGQRRRPRGARRQGETRQDPRGRMDAALCRCS